MVLVQVDTALCELFHPFFLLSSFFHSLDVLLHEGVMVKFLNIGLVAHILEGSRIVLQFRGKGAVVFVLLELDLLACLVLLFPLDLVLA